MEARFRHPGRSCTPRGVLACVAALVCLGLGTGAPAVTVHTWVDEAGVRHYADAPAAGAESEVLEIAGAAAVLDGSEDYYSIINQWRRLREERAANEALALERERIRAERRARRSREQAHEPVAVRGVYPFVPFYPYGIGTAPGAGVDPAAVAAPPSGRRRSVVHATPPEWPRRHFFRH